MLIVGLVSVLFVSVSDPVKLTKLSPCSPALNSASVPVNVPKSSKSMCIVLALLFITLVVSVWLSVLPIIAPLGKVLPAIVCSVLLTVISVCPLPLSSVATRCVPSKFKLALCVKLLLLFCIVCPAVLPLSAPKLKLPAPSVLRTCPSDPSLVGNKNPFRLILPVPAGSKFISSLLLVDITLLSTNFNPSVVKLSTSTLALTVKLPVIVPLPVPVNALIVGFVSVLFVKVSVVALPTSVSVAGGRVSVTLPEYALCAELCSLV